MPVTATLTFFFIVLMCPGRLLPQGALDHVVPVTAIDQTACVIPGLDSSVVLLSRRPTEVDWRNATTVAYISGDTLALRDTTSAYDILALRLRTDSTNTPILASGLIRLTAQRQTIASTRGRCLLVVDSEVASRLAAEIDTMRADWRAEGFTTDVLTVSASDNAADARSIRARIVEHYQRPDRPPLTHVLLLGAIPVPYSGGFSVRGAVPNPDFHEEHGGAWPADVYYADMTLPGGADAAESWTDRDISTTTDIAARPQNSNVPGDGRFDQPTLPSDVELAVGRVDMRRMTAFGTTSTSREAEITLLRLYLQRNHRYRSEPMQAYHALAGVDDFFGAFRREIQGFVVAEAFAANGYRIGHALMGDTAQTVQVDVSPESGSNRPALDTFRVLLAYGSGPGGYQHCDGVTTVEALTQRPVHATFTLLFGSYFGDMDADNNLMRAMLANDGDVLTCGWAGRPHWFLHGMAGDGTIGECFVETVNNAGTLPGGSIVERSSLAWQPYLLGTRSIHMALLGDPTLRLPAPTRATIDDIERRGDTVLLSVGIGIAKGYGDSVIAVIDVAPSVDGPWSRHSTHRLASGPSTLRLSNIPAGIVRLRPTVLANRSTTAPFASIIGRGVMTTISGGATSVNVDRRDADTEPGLMMDLGGRILAAPPSGVWFDVRRDGATRRLGPWRP